MLEQPLVIGFTGQGQGENAVPDWELIQSFKERGMSGRRHAVLQRPQFESPRVEDLIPREKCIT